MVEHGGFYRTTDQTWVKLERIQFVGACNPPTDPGRKPLSHRCACHEIITLSKSLMMFKWCHEWAWLCAGSCVTCRSCTWTIPAPPLLLRSTAPSTEPCSDSSRHSEPSLNRSLLPWWSSTPCLRFVYIKQLYDHFLVKYFLTHNARVRVGSPQNDICHMFYVKVNECMSH